MESVQGGVLIEADEINENGVRRSVTSFLNPMSAVEFAGGLKKNSDLWTRTVGPENAQVSVETIKYWMQNEWKADNMLTSVRISVGDITMVASSSVPYAMRVAIEHMMGSLMFPTNC